jgi:hypothetical protein
MGEGRGEGGFSLSLLLLRSDATRPQHRNEHRIQVIQDVVVAHAKHAIPLGLEECLALTILPRPPDVAITIELDNERVLRTNEVNHVRSDGVLSSHFQLCSAA